MPKTTPARTAARILIAHTALVALAVFSFSAQTAFSAEEPLPNFVIIFADDLGYGDDPMIGKITSGTTDADPPGTAAVASRALVDYLQAQHGLCSQSRRPPTSGVDVSNRPARMHSWIVAWRAGLYGFRYRRRG